MGSQCGVGGAMQTIDIEAAETKLADLVDRVRDGEEIVIKRDGKPIAKLVAPGLIASTGGKRVLGGLRGKLKVPENFDEMCSEEIQALFEGRDADYP